VDAQTGFYGWHPSIGEVIYPIIVALIVGLLVGLLVEPLRRQLTRIWSFCGDQIASLSDNRTNSRIRALELKVAHLK
jgi:hypothetical protein